MKTAFLILAVGLAATLPRFVPPASAGPVRQETSAEKNHPDSRTAPATPRRPRPSSIDRGSARRENAVRHGPPVTDKSGGAARNGTSIGTGTANRFTAAPRPAVPRAGAPPPANVRHRDHNPPVIGGAADSKAANRGAIGGTGMRPRP